MAGTLTHSQSRILAKTLIDLGLAESPPSVTWPAYYSNEPPTPDNCLTVFDTEASYHGRVMQGERQLHHGFQIRLRAVSHDAGWTKAQAIIAALDAVSQLTVTVSGTDYLIHSINRTTDVVALGKESPESRRILFTINALAAIRQS